MKELLYRKIAGSISEEIVQGRIPAGTRLQGVRELALEWKTSSNTVLKALDLLESGGFVKKNRGQGIFVEPETSWSPTPGRRIDLFVYDMAAPLNLMLVRAVEKAASDFGYRLTVKSGAGADAFNEAEGSDGRIIIPERSPEPDPGISGDLSRVVCIGEFSPDCDSAFSYAVADSYGGFFRSAEYLLQIGRERIAYVGASEDLGGEPGWNACRDVLAGTRFGFRRGYSASAGGWDAGRGRAAMEEILATDEYPDGLICANDTLAAGAMKACREAGLSIPGDIAVIGAWDQDIAPLLEPSLSTLRFPAALMGLTAVSFIDSLVSGRAGAAGGPDGPRLKVRFDPELVLRDSVSSVERLGPEEDELLWL